MRFLDADWKVRSGQWKRFDELAEIHRLRGLNKVLDAHFIGDEMGTIRVELHGEPERIVQEMIKDGWAETPSEAIRMALMMYLIKLKEVRMLA